MTAMPELISNERMIQARGKVNVPQTISLTGGRPIRPSEPIVVVASNVAFENFQSDEPVAQVPPTPEAAPKPQAALKPQATPQSSAPPKADVPSPATKEATKITATAEPSEQPLADQ